MQKELKIYKTKNGKCPFVDWIENLKDLTAKTKIKNRIHRLRFGHYGDCKYLDQGLKELRIHSRSGYRIYFADLEETLLILLMGGNKNTQTTDIQKAKNYLSDFKERFYE